MADKYDIEGIIQHVLQTGTDISPADRAEWSMFCCALKVLDYDEDTFVALSSGRERDSRATWRKEKAPWRYRTEDQAKGMIVSLAKSAGIDTKNFLLSPDSTNTPRNTPATATARRGPNVRQAPADKPVTPPRYITPAELAAAAAHYRRTTLFRWLVTFMDPAATAAAFEAYRIGASKWAEEPAGLATSFPYIGGDGLCVDCKIIQFKTDGHKATWPNGNKKINSALARLKENDRRAEWCNFGDHIAAQRPADPVGIVESEKTALCMAIVYPGVVWVAVGSKQNLKPERVRQYAGRCLRIYPDRDGVDLWAEQAKELSASRLFHSVAMDNVLPNTPGEEHDDIWDIVARSIMAPQVPPPPTTSPEPPRSSAPTTSPDMAEALALFGQMTAECPALAQLADSLQLQVTGIAPGQLPQTSNPKRSQA